MYHTSASPALISDTLIITSDSEYKSTTAYVAHSSIEGRSTFINKEDDVHEIIIDLTSDEHVADAILQYFKLRKSLGMPVKNRVFILQGDCPMKSSVKDELETLGCLVRE